MDQLAVSNHFAAVSFYKDIESGVSRPYVMEFTGVPNRSTSATPYGQAVRGTSVRPGGFYDFLVRSGSDVLKTGIMEVDCD